MSIDDLEEMGFKLKLDCQSCDEKINIIDKDLFDEIVGESGISMNVVEPIHTRTESGFIFLIYKTADKIKKI